MEELVIIGNGISGVTAARHVRKKDSSVAITIISSETEHFFSRTALMYIYMGHMTYENTKPYEDDFWEKNNICLVFDYVNEVDFNQTSLSLKSGKSIKYSKLVLAVGSKPNKFGWKGQDAKGVQGLYSYQDLKLLEKNSKSTTSAVIIGGGLIGVEFAEMLHSKGIKVHFLVREKRFWNNVLPNQEADLISKHIVEHDIDLQLGEELDEIIENENKVVGVKTKSGKHIDCQLVGLTVGVRPNVDFLRSSELEIDKGIIVNEYLETNISNVYAVGDCAQFQNPVEGRRALEQVWYTGRIMGETVAKSITGTRTKYSPGIWFNSAKFFDVEYQTYGIVNSQLLPNQSEFYWEHSDGKMCMHFVYETGSRKLVGINSLGIRLRHHAFNDWLVNGCSIEYVLEHLTDANFDPELYKQYEPAIVAQFNSENGATIQVKKKSWKRILNFLNQ